MAIESDEFTGVAHRATGIDEADLAVLFEYGELVSYEAGAYLFHESMPRTWFGLVESGQVEIVRGTHGTEWVVATIGTGAVLAERALLDASPHTVGARTRAGVTVWQFSREVIARIQAERPEVLSRVIAAVALVLAQRMGYLVDQLTHGPSHDYPRGEMRKEHDLLGVRELPYHVYYGVQTLRAIENFPISGTTLARYGHFIDAFAMVKKAAALANHELGVLSGPKCEAICQACDEIIGGGFREDFVVDMVQGGAGTSTNMNLNEVIANRGLELMGHHKGEYQYLHPNDDVNCSQSTNDAYPTAVKLGVYLSLQDTLGALEELQHALSRKGEEFSDVIKMGRTQLQDAVPMTLGQEFDAYSVMVGEAIRHLRRVSQDILDIGMGATAIGTGINSPAGYAQLVTEKLAEVSKIPVFLAENLVEATQDSGDFVHVSANMKRAAVQLSKICNDLRLLSMGPRCGLAEINLPPMQPGSSIMPGKVNPVIPEVVSQVCFQIIGHDMTVTIAAEASQLELNMAEPIIAYDLLQGLLLLRNACVTLTSRCIVGITANRERCREYVENSIGLVTALNPLIGYEKSVAIAQEALITGGRVSDLVLAKGWLSQAQLDDVLRPERMTHPRRSPVTSPSGR